MAATSSTGMCVTEFLDVQRHEDWRAVVVEVPRSLFLLALEDAAGSACGTQDAHGNAQINPAAGTPTHLKGTCGGTRVDPARRLARAALRDALTEALRIAKSSRSVSPLQLPLCHTCRRLCGIPLPPLIQSGCTCGVYTYVGMG